MNYRKQAKLGFAGIVVAALAGTTFGTPVHAEDAPRPNGDRSLAEVLAADSGYDSRWNDFDIVEKAVLTVLKAKPDSPVAALADGDTRLTAFIPNDRAFRRLVRDLTDRTPHTERQTFRAVAKVADVDTLESVLLYHVVVGKTLTSPRVLALDDEAVETALGATFTVRVRGERVFLVDQDRNDRNPKVVALDINRGNKQVAHGINRVLRPMDL